MVRLNQKGWQGRICTGPLPVHCMAATVLRPGRRDVSVSWIGRVSANGGRAPIQRVRRSPLAILRPEGRADPEVPDSAPWLSHPLIHPSACRTVACAYLCAIDTEAPATASPLVFFSGEMPTESITLRLNPDGWCLLNVGNLLGDFADAWD